MKKTGLIIMVVAVMFSILITLTGCDGKTEKKSKDNVINKIQGGKTDSDQKDPKKIELKNGTYEYVPETEDDEMLVGTLYLEIEDGKIIVFDGFAGLTLEGTYQIDGGKIVGKYTSMTYIDHSKGGEYTTESISDEIEMYILEDGSLRDFIGYGASLNNIMMQDALYRLAEEN